MSSQEENKLSDPQSQPQANPQGIQWLWQSDVDPWNEKDTTKWNWAPYSYDNSELIEDSFSQGLKVADLGDYEIDLEKMLQVNKKDRSRVRRIKREGNIAPKSRFMLELSVPIPIEKIQQTINPAFGTVQHFLDFIMKRTQETYTLFQRLTYLSLDCKQDKFKDVIEAVIKCIQSAAESNEKVTKSRGLSYWKSPLQEAKQILTEVENKSKNPDLTLRDFLKMVLKMYTEESFVCYWLNELLRSENWPDINVFTPYLVCLAYTFQIKDYVIPYQEPQGFRKKLRSIFKTQKLKVYRGTALTTEHLNFYHPGNTRFFSWNGVTSTSRNKDQALKFIRLSLKRPSPAGEKKMGVLFMIEADFASAMDSEGMIDISKDSRFPSEEEVILAPGSVFEVISFQLKEPDKIYEVKLALRKKFKENHKILGDFQSKIIERNKVILSGLKYEDIIKILPLIEGNQIVESLKIEECVLDSHLLDLITDIIKTTKITNDNIMLYYNTFTVNNLATLCYYFPSQNLGQICYNNNIIIKADIQNTNSKSQSYLMKEVQLKSNGIKALAEKNLFNHFCNEMSSHTQITHLNLEIKNSLPTKGHLVALISSLQKLVNLQHLSLDFEDNKFVSNETLESLQKTLSSGIEMPELKNTFMTLKKLELFFNRCSNITENVIDNLGGGLKSLTSLAYLHLDLRVYNKLSDTGVSSLADAFKSLPSLTYLHLDFQFCIEISDEGIEKLKEALKLLTSLNHLHLDFEYCKKISDEGLAKLKDGLKSLTSLNHLHLSFQNCDEISDQGVDKLTGALKSLISLTNLYLDFSFCGKVSDEGIKKFKYAFESLTSLTHLHLTFNYCRNISDEGLDKFKDGLRLLTSLAHLHLDFGCRDKISDEGIDKLKEALKSLSGLTHLSLNFEGCSKISDEGIDKLKDALMSLSLLTHLHLNVVFCKEISNGGQKKLKDYLKSRALLVCNLYFEDSVVEVVKRKIPSWH